MCAALKQISTHNRVSRFFFLAVGERRLAEGGERLSGVGPADGRAILLLPTEQRDEVFAEDAVERAVEDEVDGRVDRQQKVCDLANPPHHVVRLVIAEAVHRRDDGVRRHAQHKHDYNGHEHDGDSASRRQTALRRRSRPSQRAHDEVAERAQDGNGHERAQAVLRPRVGDDEAAHAPQVCDVDADRGLVRVVVPHEHRTVAESKRRRQHGHRHEHEDDGGTRTRDATHRARARRVTHEHVSLRGDGDRQPGGYTHGHVEQVVRVGIHVAKRAVPDRRVDVDQERDDEVEDVVDEFDGVSHRQADQERVRRRRHLTPTQHDDAEDVTRQAEEADDGVEEETGDELCH